MLDELLRAGLSFVLVFLFLVGDGGTVRMRVVLGLLFGLVMEVGRGDESDDLFERVFWVFPDQEVYEGGYATEKTLKVADDQGRSKFSGGGAVIGFERYGYWKRKVSIAGSVGGWIEGVDIQRS